MVSKLINFFLQFFHEKTHDAVNDPRPQAAKDLDYKYGKDFVFPSAGETNVRITKLPFPAYIQDATSGCGSFSASHGRRATEGTINFPLSWYRTRSNYPGQGMFLQDVLRLMTLADENTSDEPAPSYLTENYANSLPLRDLFNNSRKDDYEYTQIDPYDSDSVWTAVANGFPVVISFYSTLNEWDFEVYPRDITALSIAPVRHFVLVLPNSNHLSGGYDWVSIIDSSPYKGCTLRHVRKDFLDKRMYLGAGFYYRTEKSTMNVTEHPYAVVSYGTTSSDVLTLQKMMVQLGLMDPRHTTGYYGPITAKAVLQWQMQNIPDYPDIEALAGHYWGSASIKKAKELYE